MAIARRKQGSFKFEKKDRLRLVPLGVLLIAAAVIGIILGILDKD
jgi:hypothetical protein